MDGTGELFKPALASFPANLKPIPVAFPNDRIVDYNGLVDLLLPRFQGEPRFLLLGESFSGPLVLKIASRRLKGLAGVILLNSFVTSPVPRWISFLPLRLLFSFPPPKLALREFLVGYDAPADLVEFVRSTVRKVPARILSARVKEVAKCDLQADFANCPCTILWIHSQDDHVVSPRNLTNQFQDNPNITWHKLRGPHLLFQRFPGECWNAIEQFEYSSHDRP